MVSSFLREATVQRIVIVVQSGALDVSLQLPVAFDKGVYFLKKEPARLSPENVSAVITCGDVRAECTQQLEQLSSTLDQVYLPLFGNPGSLREWPESVRLDVRKQFHDLSGMVFSSQGHAKGQALLPVAYTKASCECVNAREKVHTVEAAVASWMSQIHSLLATESMDMSHTETNMGVDDELDFWVSKAGNLELLNQQLAESQCTEVVEFLVKCDSSYAKSLSQLKQDVASGLEEATDIVASLAPLREPVSELRTCPFECITTPLKHVMHVISLVWSFSRHFGQPVRVVGLMGKLCNDVMCCAVRYVECSELFSVAPEEAAYRLQAVRATCHLLKRSFLETKARVRMIRKSDRSW